MMNLLEGKTAIITGGSRGIGKAIVEIFVKQGANVAFTYSSSSDAAKAIEKELSTNNVKVRSYKSDASNFEEAQLLAASVLEEFGSIDILINNAGITKDNLLMRMSEEDFDRVIQVNLKSVFNMTKAVQRTMLKQRKGSIINMSSVIGVKGNAGQSNYAASKAGILGFTKSMAIEWGEHNIRVNTICPTFIVTPLTKSTFDNPKRRNWIEEKIKLGRLGEVEDIMGAVVFLASEASSMITGSSLMVDGGWTAD